MLPALARRWGRDKPKWLRLARLAERCGITVCDGQATDPKRDAVPFAGPQIPKPIQLP